MKRILVVDDEPAILKVVGLFLQSDAVNIVTAANGAEGLRLFQEEKCDLVISDRVMPVMDGEKLAMAIKSESPQTPIILITGLFSSLINATPFDGFVPKPFTRDQLRQAVAQLLPEYRDALAA